MSRSRKTSIAGLKPAVHDAQLGEQRIGENDEEKDKQPDGQRRLGEVADLAARIS
jgi:hypothetical protein